MGRSFGFGLALVLASAVAVGCGGGGTTSSSAGAVVVSTVTAPLFNTTPSPFTVTGAGFATLAGTTVTVRFTASSGTPFAGGTSTFADVPGTVVSDTEVVGTSPVGPGPTFTATVTVILPSTVQGTSAGAIATFLGITVDSSTPNRVPADVPTPIVLAGNGFAPTGSVCTIRFRAPTGTPFLGGTSAILDVPGTVDSLTQISGTTAVTGLSSKLNARVEVLLSGGGAGGSVGPILLFEVRPTAVADLYTGAIGNVPFAVAAGAGLRANDTDPDGDALTVTAGTFATSQGGSVTIAADGSFTYRSPLGFEGADTFSYTLSDGFLTAPGSATVNVAEVVWFVDSAAAAGGSGRSEAPFQTVAAFNAIQGAGPTPAQVDDYVSVRDRGATYAGAITLLAGQRLWGSGEALVIGSTTVLAASTRPILQAGSGATVTVATGNQIRGIDLRNTAGRGIAGTGFGTLTIRSSRVVVTGGRALDLATGTLDAQLVDVSSTTSPNEGSLLSAVGGTLAISGTYTANTPTTDGLKLTSSDVATTIAAVSISSTLGQGIDLVGGTGLFQVDGGTLDLIGRNGLQAASRSGAVTFRNAVVSRTGNAGVPAQEGHGVRLRECTGAVLVQNCDLTDLRDNDPAFFTDNNGVDLLNTTGTLPSLTITQCDFKGTAVGLNGDTTDHGARVLLEGTAVVTTVTFTDNTASMTDGSAIQVWLDPDDSGNAPSIGTLDITDNPSIQTQGWGVEIRVDGLSTLPSFHVDRNRLFGDNASFPTLGFSASGGILFNMGEFATGIASTATATGTISDNDIDDLGDGAFDRGIDVLTQDATVLNLTVNANTVDGTAAEGISLRSFDATKMTVKLTNNALAATRQVLLAPGGGALQATSDQTSTLCLRATGNAVTIAPRTLAMNANGASQLQLDGIAPANPTPAQVVAFVAPLNTGVLTVTAVSGGGTFGTCTIP